MRKLFILMIVYGLFFVSFETKAAEAIDVKTIINKMDKLYRSNNSYAKIEMKIVNPNWERTMLMDIWTEDLNKTFIRILSPAKDKGVATLRIKREMWNYFPKIDKVMRIPPSMMMGSWMGSDFTNDDLVKESTFLDDYDSKLINPEGSQKDLYYVELIPKKTTATVWAKIILIVKRHNFIPVRQEYYDEKGNKKRLITFKDIKEFGGRRIPSVMEVTPLHKKKNKTILKYIKLDFDKGVNKTIFSLKNLKKRR